MTKMLMLGFVMVSALSTTGCKKKTAGGDSGEILAKMEGFQKSMCECKDKACADKVQEDMTKWSTDMAKNAKPDEKPDPELAKKSADVMTKYSECMTKVSMAGAGVTGDKPSDPPAEPPPAAGSADGSAAPAAGSAAAAPAGDAPCVATATGKVFDTGEVEVKLKNTSTKAWTYCQVWAFTWDKDKKLVGKGGMGHNSNIKPGAEETITVRFKDNKDQDLVDPGAGVELFVSDVKFEDKTEWHANVDFFAPRSAPGPLTPIKK